MHNYVCAHGYVCIMLMCKYTVQITVQCFLQPIFKYRHGYAVYYNELNFGELLIWPFGSFVENRKIKDRQIVRYVYAIGISHHLIKTSYS